MVRLKNTDPAETGINTVSAGSVCMAADDEREDCSLGEVFG